VQPLLLAEEPSWRWLSKPAGLPVFPPHKDPDGPSLHRWLLTHYPDQDQPFPRGFSGGLAHRLDTATSGVVLAARSPQDLDRARAAFAAGALHKTYRFLTHKSVTWSTHHVTTPVAHHPRRRDRMVPRRSAGTAHRGRWYPADTRLRQLDGALWEAVITTGVMHQIRVHAATVGLALTGDRLYGGGTRPPEGAPPEATFALHHVGLVGGGLRSPVLAQPAWWGPYS